MNYLFSHTLSHCNKYAVSNFLFKNNFTQSQIIGFYYFSWKFILSKWLLSSIISYQTPQHLNSINKIRLYIYLLLNATHSYFGSTRDLFRSLMCHRRPQMIYKHFEYPWCIQYVSRHILYRYSKLS